jgi:hypothetical protein
MRTPHQPAHIIGEYRRLTAEIETLEADRDAAKQVAAHAQARMRDAASDLHQRSTSIESPV